MVTVRPRASSNAPNEAAAMPLPKDDTTPPVIKMHFVIYLNFNEVNNGKLRKAPMDGIRVYKMVITHSMTFIHPFWHEEHKKPFPTEESY